MRQQKQQNDFVLMNQGEKQSKPLLLVVACALIDHEKRILIAKRPKTRDLAGLWEFPGGKIEPGETPEQALVRELEEELGIEVNPACLAPLTFVSHDYPRFHLLMPLYYCRTWSGLITPEEGQDFAWVKANRLTNYDMPPADEPLKAWLRDFL